jgi:hypothetical protein
LSRRSKACEVLAGTGVRGVKIGTPISESAAARNEGIVRAELEFGAPEIGLPSRSLGEGWPGIRVARPSLNGVLRVES